MINPFAFKTGFLAKHAQHVVLIHFPIALFVTAAIFDFIAHWTKKSALGDAAYFNLSVAALSTFPVIATGILSWQFQLEGERLKGLLLMHVQFAIASSALIWLVWWLHRRARTRAEALPGYRIPIEAIAMFMIALTGHLGGFLSGVNTPD